MQNKNRRIIYLLGAGFSNAITNKRAPLTDELGKQLKGIFSQEVEDKYGFSPGNIELFLTKVDLQLLENDDTKLKDARIELTNKILEIFATKNLGNVNNLNNQIEISDVADKIINMLFRNNDTILTLNYDCYLENILFNKAKWSHLGGWGEIFSFPEDTVNKNKYLNIEIFKLHGSINFVLVAPLDKDGFNFNREKLMLKWEVNDDIFPGWHESSSWTETVKEYIVLPSYLKQFEYKDILKLWRNAAFRIQEADKLVIIGTSLREEDYPLKFLLSLINKNADIILIDPKAKDIKNKLIRFVPINPNNIKPIQQGIEDITEDFVNKIYNE